MKLTRGSKIRKNRRIPKASLEDKRKADEYLTKAKRHILTKAPKRAVPLLKKAFKFDPNNRLVKVHLARIYLNQGIGHLNELRIGRAERSLKKVLIYEPKNITARKALEQIYYKPPAAKKPPQWRKVREKSTKKGPKILARFITRK